MSRMSANLLLLFAAIVWGAAFVAQATAMDSLGPLAFTGIRFALAALAVLPFAWYEWKRSTNRLSRESVIYGILVGVLFFVAITAQQYGFLTTTVTNAGFLTALYVVFTPILGFILFRIVPNPIIWLIVVLSLTGTYLLAGNIEGLRPGDFLMIVSAVFWALQVLFMGRMVTSLGNPVTIALIQFATTATIGLVGGIALEPISLAGIKGAWGELAYTGILSGGLAFTLQAIAQRYTSAANAAILLSSESLFAALFGAVILGEQLSDTKWLGCAMIFSCILLVELLPQITKRLRNRQGEQPA